MQMMKGNSLAATLEIKRIWKEYRLEERTCFNVCSSYLMLHSLHLVFTADTRYKSQTSPTQGSGPRSEGLKCLVGCDATFLYQHTDLPCGTLMMVWMVHLMRSSRQLVLAANLDGYRLKECQLMLERSMRWRWLGSVVSKSYVGVVLSAKLGVNTPLILPS
jgi:hypothetical protein